MLIGAGCKKPAIISIPNPKKEEVFTYGDFKAPPANPMVVEALKLEEQTALKQPDPRDDLRKLCSRSMATGPDAGLQFIRRAQKHLAGKKLPPNKYLFFGQLAALASPHDIKLRDELLILAIEEVKQLLADDGLWKAPPVPPNATPYGNPQQAFDAQKTLLQLEVRLWRILLDNPTDRRKAIGQLRDLLASPETRVCFPPCAVRSCGEDLRKYAANIDPALLLSAWPEADKEERANFCYHAAHDRHQAGLRDRFTQFLIRHGAPRPPETIKRRLELLQHYDIDEAISEVRKLPYERNSYPSDADRRLLPSMLRTLARMNPERAIELAKSEPDPLLSEACKFQVANAVVRQHPEKLEWAMPAAGEQGDAIRSLAVVAFAQHGEIDKARVYLRQIADPQQRVAAQIHMAFAATKLTKQDRVAEAQQAVDAALTTGQIRLDAGLLHLLYWLDPAVGSNALRRILRVASPTQLERFATALGEAPAADMLLLYQTAKAGGVDALGKFPRCYQQLAKAAPEFALKAIADLPENVRPEARVWAACGLASHDLKRAQEFVASTAKDGYRPSFDELASHYLAAHPDKLAELRDKMSMQFIAQAAQMALLQTEKGEGFFEILRGLDARQADFVASHISSQGFYKELANAIYEKLKQHADAGPAIQKLANNCRLLAEKTRYSWDWEADR
jgi:hypothetical protein